MSKLFKHLTFIGTFLLLSTVATSTFAQDVRYVSDVLHLPLRSGKGNEFRITHRGMPSGTQLIVLEENEDGAWLRVKTKDDKEGWVRSQYLISEPTASIKLKALQNKVSNLNSGSKKLLDQISSAEASNTDLSKKLAKSEQQLVTTLTELNTLKKVSANAISLNQQYQTLLTKHQMLQAESDTAHAENQRLKSQKSHNERLYGAFLLICGIAITIAIQAMSLRRKKSEWG